MLFGSLYGPHDEQLYKLAMSVLKGEHAWLEQGIVDEAYYHDDAEPRTDDGRSKMEDRKLVSV